MPRKNVPISIGLAIAILLGACAATPTPSQDVGQRIMETLSPAAYQRIVPHLAALTTGDRIDQKIRWGFFGVLRGKLAPPLILASGWVASLSADFPLVLADGWVASLSGDFLGAHSGFGKLIGQTGNVVLGEHVFGYLLGGARLVPQYVVVMSATVIARDEYERLSREKVANVGWAPAPEERVRIYFKDVSVKETRPLQWRTDLEDAKITGTLADAIRMVSSIERFKVAEGTLASLAPGTDYWEALAALKMSILTLDSGITYKAWLADGDLGNSWAKLTPGGYFLVYRFGYLQDNGEVPKLALIFKNGRVHKVVPHGTQEELERHLD